MKRQVVVAGLLCGMVWMPLQGLAEGKKTEAAQLVTYVKPAVPSTVQEGEKHSVGLTAMMQADGRLHDLTPVEPDDPYAGAAKDAAAQWIYQPFKRDGQPIAMPVYLTVMFGAGEHVATPKQPVLLSSRLVPLLVGHPVEALSPQAGVHGMVPVAVTVGADGVVGKAQGMSGPEMFRNTAAVAARGAKYRVVLLDGVPVEFGTTVPVAIGR